MSILPLDVSFQRLPLQHLRPHLSKFDVDEKARSKDDLTGNVIAANKAAIENLRPLLTIFEA